ncbi:hypothetical protein SCP_1702450 [Sparassis crispa]|uniref:Cytochrome P450 n=1 Tax=Sparassis crispa TaxID=139825 RepID=A0A401H6A8_9APHY|nr:hypothetical protein SCP_1702450 [Sparassis crispa]GBE89919.1 hypothetical protein SCP_1702450 [Sparassis crispa]
MTMSLVFYFILSQPKYYKMLQAELDAAFTDPAGLLDSSKLANLPFLNAVLSETLRLGTPFFLPRIVPPSGLTLEGRFIPGGTIVAVAVHSQQTSPANFYPAPLDFLPERWLPGGLGPESITERTALMSFSSGPHVCVAKAFAYQEMRFVTARLVLAHDMKLEEGFDVKAYRDGILNMRTTVLQSPLMVKATKRRGFDLAKLG